MNGVVRNPFVFCKQSESLRKIFCQNLYKCFRCFVAIELKRLQIQHNLNKQNTLNIVGTTEPEGQKDEDQDGNIAHFLKIYLFIFTNNSHLYLLLYSQLYMFSSRRFFWSFTKSKNHLLSSGSFNPDFPNHLKLSHQNCSFRIHQNCSFRIYQNVLNKHCELLLFECFWCNVFDAVPCCTRTKKKSSDSRVF